MTQSEHEAHVVETAKEDIERLRRKIEDSKFNLGKTLTGLAQLEQDKSIYTNEITSFECEIERLKNKIEFYKP